MRYLQWLAAMCFLGSALPAHADVDTSNGKVSAMVLGSTTGNVLYLRVSPAPTGASSCFNASGYWHYTLPLDTALAKNIYTLLLTLSARDQPINFAGLGVCNETSGVETLRAIGVVIP
jgi:hypothetical protein